jgi:glycerophosphoryl diester phosphodiesterase
MELFSNIWEHGVFQGVTSNAIWLILGVLVVWCRRKFRFSPTGHTIKYFFSRKKYVLIWNDHNIETSEKIISQLPKISRIKYVALKEAENLLIYNLKPRYIHEIILIISDVTKFSEIEKCRRDIQLKLILYVRKGGTLLGTHDIIYRRCRNNALQEAFGCKLVNFQRDNKPINVLINKEYANHPLVKGLDDEFTLEDGEVCWGDWSKDAKFLIVTKKKYRDQRYSVPILSLRSIGNQGTFIWLNSGDKGEYLANSISKPQTEFIQILSNSIHCINVSSV